MSKYNIGFEVYYIGYVSFIKYPALRHNKCKWKVAARVIDANTGKSLIDYCNIEYAVKPNKRDLRKLRAEIMWEIRNFIRNNVEFATPQDITR
ncbi:MULTISPECIES: hypothetical protein [Proteus]|uniref:hypothetical protein n=1 Tax=Proteus TaxID=583 RepID=UPI001376B172|nr:MULTISPECIES: hypothetical protein [Proteus]MBS3831923.1 hypothetical protein [Proteus mirabilis]MBU5403460.1 hypothetical protein [Proteus mirabilis]MCT0074380.1 hypothetical protein [Proteus mirabilis]MCT6519282.1 hypothetical protein [Proteus vulgaris]MDF7281883.1 hypothetical protein [Proteus mirabilis]